jgi:superfamily II DNA helicase RecQ
MRCWVVTNAGGSNFRKSYQFIHELRAFTDAPLGVFTATMTPNMKKEVALSAGLRKDSLHEMIASPDRCV